MTWRKWTEIGFYGKVIGGILIFVIVLSLIASAITISVLASKYGTYEFAQSVQDSFNSLSEEMQAQNMGLAYWFLSSWIGVYVAWFILLIFVVISEEYGKKLFDKELAEKGYENI